MEEVEVPEYFICPISLQIMKDPVIAITGITYDRSSIEKWLFQSQNTNCPVSKHPLSRDSILTPNHILFKLIQTWRTTPNPATPVDRNIPTQNPINKLYILNLLTNLSVPNLALKAIIELEFLAEKEKHRPCLVEAGVPKAMLTFVSSTRHKNGKITTGLQQAISILYFILYPPDKTTQFLLQYDEIIDSLTWALGCDTSNKLVKSHAMVLLKMFIEKANSNVQEILKLDFFKTIVRVLSEGLTPQGTRAALYVMLGSCPRGRHRSMMVEAGAVFALIEMELGLPEKKSSELILQLLFQLCCCADGRARLVGHAAGITVVTKRIMKVSPAADDSAISIIYLISKFSGTDWVVQEMLRAGTVTRLCLVLQTNCDSYLKEKAREILRRHTDVWKDSSCVDVMLLSRYTRLDNI